jgi:predicted ATPase
MMTVPLKNSAIAGYRSFGEEIQHFEQLAKVHLLIGKTNAGKSNVLHFLHNVLLSGNTTSQHQANKASA